MLPGRGLPMHERTTTIVPFAPVLLRADPFVFRLVQRVIAVLRGGDRGEVFNIA